MFRFSVWQIWHTSGTLTQLNEAFTIWKDVPLFQVLRLGHVPKKKTFFPSRF